MYDCNSAWHKISAQKLFLSEYKVMTYNCRYILESPRKFSQNRYALPGGIYLINLSGADIRSLRKYSCIDSNGKSRLESTHLDFRQLIHICEAKECNLSL